MQTTLLALSLLLSSALHAGAQTASCAIQNSSILSRSRDGVLQVSNRVLLQIQCSVPALPVPGKPGEFRPGLTVATSAARIAGQSGKPKSVPSDAETSGGGSSGGQA